MPHRASPTDLASAAGWLLALGFVVLAGAEISQRLARKITAVMK